MCLLVTFVSPAKTAEPIEMPFAMGWLVWVVGLKNNALDRVKIGRLHSQPWGVTSQRCGLLPNYTWRLAIIIIIITAIIIWPTAPHVEFVRMCIEWVSHFFTQPVTERRLLLAPHHRRLELSTCTVCRHHDCQSYITCSPLSSVGVSWLCLHDRHKQMQLLATRRTRSLITDILYYIPVYK